MDFRYVEDMTPAERREEIDSLRLQLRDLGLRSGAMVERRKESIGRRLDRLCAYEAGMEMGYNGDYRAFTVTDRHLRRRPQPGV